MNIFLLFMFSALQGTHIKWFFTCYYSRYVYV